MSWSQLKTFIWLRWRLTVNVGKRTSTVGLWVNRLLKLLLVAFACGSFVAFFLLGRFVLADTSPTAFMLIWDAAVAAFLVVWLMGLMVELQRSEMLSLDRFLHLPVSPAGAFLINYVGASVNLSVLLFLPGMMGLSIGLLVSRGPVMSALLVLVPCFFLMMTAVTYQFRGWLASLMTNRKRRQTIMVVTSFVFLSIVLLPAVLTEKPDQRRGAEQSAPITVEQPDPADPADPANAMERFEPRLRLVNALAPPGWLPHGASKLLEGHWWSALSAALGMGLIGVLSLLRSYRTTLRLYKGDFAARSGSGGARAPRAAPPSTVIHDAARRTLTERRLPLISEHASAIAVACFRSLLRSPEAKLMFLGPLFVVIFFSSMFASSAIEVSEHGRALRAMGIAVVMLLMSMLSYVGNQFAFDRDGFRAFMLSSASRRDILLGKNLSFLPFGLAFMALAVLAYHWFYPLRPDHLVAVLLQTLSAYLVCCMLGNLLSVYAPIAIRPTSGMPLPGQGAKTFLQMLMFFAFALPLSAAFVPLGIEYAMHALDWHAGFPAFLVLSLVQAGLTLWLYLKVLDSQGLLLQRREQQVLRVVTQRAD